jgi:hypothetical protein
MASHTLNRQQIRERKRKLEREDNVRRDRHASLQELNDAERLIEQKRSGRHQMALQTGSLAVAILAQIPEKRDGVEGIARRATQFLEDLLDSQHRMVLQPDDEDDEDDDEDDEELPLASVAHFDGEIEDVREMV